MHHGHRGTGKCTEISGKKMKGFSGHADYFLPVRVRFGAGRIGLGLLVW
jgi:hypothetical protein